MGGCLSGFKSEPDTTREEGAPRGSTMNKPANSASDNFLMDIGVKEKNDVYDRDLKARQMASTAALKEFEAQQKTNDKDSLPATAVTEAETETEAEAEAETETVLTEEVDTALTEVETISQDTFDEDTDFVGEVVPVSSVGTAAGGAAQAAAASPTSVGPAEDEAIDLMKKGRRSTILTTPSGLLGDGEEDKKTRRRRSLIG